MPEHLPNEPGPENAAVAPRLNESQQRRLRVTCEHIDRMLAEIEGVLAAASSALAFPRYVPDVVPAERRLLENYIARLRAQLVRILDGQGIERQTPNIPAARAVRTDLTFIEIAAEELAPSYMRGYGALSAQCATELNGIVGEIKSLVARMSQVLAGASTDLQQSLERVRAAGGQHLDGLPALARVIERRGLVEFRPRLEAILDRLEDRCFEIGIFGRVSAGKSSLLNAILDAPILPVGVTPITTVPTRIVHGTTAMVEVSFFDRGQECLPVARLAELAAEEHNPGNTKHVSRIVVRTPAPRLRAGVSFVDTPGIGALAARGAEATMAYLPRCDLGIVLIDAGSSLSGEEIGLIHALLATATPVSILLSKADMVSLADRERLAEYTRRTLRNELRIEAQVRPVSVSADHRALLDAWFEAEIGPLCARAQELRIESMQGKVTALSEEVQAVLRSRLSAGSQRLIAPESARKVEDRLRTAAGRFAETSHTLERSTALLARARPQLVRHIATTVIETDCVAAPEQTTPTTLAREAALQALRGEAAAILRELQTLARQQHEALTEAASAFDLPLPDARELSECLREMPAPEIWLPGLELKRPRLARILGRRFAIASFARQLEHRAGEPLQSSLELHARMLESWVRQTIKAMETAFNAGADGYRAQAERVISGGGNPSDCAGVESDLKELLTASSRCPGQPGTGDNAQPAPGQRQGGPKDVAVPLAPQAGAA